MYCDHVICNVVYCKNVYVEFKMVFCSSNDYSCIFVLFFIYLAMSTIHHSKTVSCLSQFLSGCKSLISSYLFLISCSFLPASISSSSFSWDLFTPFSSFLSCFISFSYTVLNKFHVFMLNAIITLYFVYRVSILSTEILLLV